MASTVSFTVRQSGNGSVLGTVEHKGFWGMTQAEAAKALLPVVQEAFPQASIEAVAFGATKADGKGVKNLGGDVYVNTLPTGANPASVGTRTNGPTVSKQASPNFDAQVMATLRANPTLTLAEAEERVRYEQDLAARLKRQAELSDLYARMDTMAERITKAHELFCDLYAKLGEGESRQDFDAFKQAIDAYTNVVRVAALKAIASLAQESEGAAESEQA